MFTGIVETQARIVQIQKNHAESRFTIEPEKRFENIILGESIAINGACLTVEKAHSTLFTAFASKETLSKTNLADLKVGSVVNCERALALGDRLGGHIVAGHVDCVTSVLSIQDDLSSKQCTIALPSHLRGLIISQGSVALDGISLTIATCADTEFTVNVIPETWKTTTISRWKTGSVINLETDVLGKYVLSHIQVYTNPTQLQETKSSKIDENFLLEHGFL